MIFGEALEQMKNGHRVARKAWSRGGDEIFVWVLYMPPTELPENRVTERIRRFIPSGPVMLNGYFVICYERLMKKGNEWVPVWQPGWTPTQDDLQIDDWEMLDDQAPRILRPPPKPLKLV